MTTTTTTHTAFRRRLLQAEATDKVSTTLQHNLANMVDLALLLKQAHWNVVGTNFRSLHLQLDEIIETVRSASDEIAERISALGIAPDGRSGTISQESDLVSYPPQFVSVQETVERTADAVKVTIDGLRAAIDRLSDLDPISEDLLIGIAGPMEKHLWMLQAQELDKSN
jgi:starvation-inducible DNA-binding protein